MRRPTMMGECIILKIIIYLTLVWLGLTKSRVAASEMNTLMGIRGRDFVLLGGDSAFFRSVVIMDAEYHKVVEVSDNILVAASGNQGDVDMFIEWLKRNACLMRLESSRPVGVRTLANFARRSLADKLRKQGASQAVTALLGGWDEVVEEPQLFWLDALGALQSVPFGAHGLASRFALSLLDNGFREGMSLIEARDLMEACFKQLEKRYLVSSVGFSMKVVDRTGCRDVVCRGEEGGHGQREQRKWVTEGKPGEDGGSAAQGGGPPRTGSVSVPIGRPKSS